MSDEESARDAGEPDERADDQFVARVTVVKGQAAALLRRGEFDFGDHPHVEELPDGTAHLVMFLSRMQIDGLRGEGFEVQLGTNMSARARERRAEVGEGDRFDGGRVVPRGLGRKIGGPGDRRPPDERPSDERPPDRGAQAS